MNLNDIRREHRRVTTKSTYKRETVLRDRERDIVKRSERMVRRRGATRILAGVDENGRLKHLLFKFRNNMI